MKNFIKNLFRSLERERRIRILYRSILENINSCTTYQECLNCSAWIAEMGEVPDSAIDRLLEKVHDKVQVIKELALSQITECSLEPRPILVSRHLWEDLLKDQEKQNAAN